MNYRTCITLVEIVVFTKFYLKLKKNQWSKLVNKSFNITVAIGIKLFLKQILSL